jgi:hypothetical protein
MALRDTQDVLIFEMPTSGKLRDTQDCLIFEVPVTVSSPFGYPLMPPAIAGIGPQDFTLAMQNLVGENVSPFTASEQEQQWSGQFFTIDANLPPMPFAQAEQWIAFLGSLFGKTGTFLMGDYNRLAPQGPWSGPALVNGANASGSNQLNLRDANPSVANWAVAGDYLQITAFNSQLGVNVQRLYKVLQNANSGPGGLVTLFIFPNLRESLSDGQAIVTVNTAGTFRLTQNTVTPKTDKNRSYAISFKAREAMLP